MRNARRKLRQLPGANQVVAGQSWAPSYSGTPSQLTQFARTTGSIGQQIGTNTALAEIFSMLIERKWDLQDFRMEQQAFRRNDLRDNRLSLERYGVSHDNDLESRAYSDFLGDGGDPHDWLAYSKNLFPKSTHAGLADRPGGAELFREQFDPVAMKAVDAGQATSSIPREAGKGLREVSGGTSAPVGKEAATSGDSTIFDIFRNHLPLQGETLQNAQNAFTEKENEDAVSRAAMVAGVKQGIGEENFDGLMWGLDKLSRPLYAVNAARKQYYAEDKDNELTGQFTSDSDNAFGVGMDFVRYVTGNVEGKPLGSGADDLTGAGLLRIADAAVKGFTGGGWGNNPNPVLSSDIIAENAAADPAHTIHDTSVYRNGVGFLNDVAFDPLSYVGFGFTKGLATTAGKQVSSRAARRAARNSALEMDASSKQLRSLSDDIAKEMDGVDPYSEGLTDLFGPEKLSGEHIYNMLGGNYKYFGTNPQKIRAVNRVEQNTLHLASMLERKATHANTEGSNAVKALADSLQARRDTVLKEFGNDVYTQELREDWIKLRGPDAPAAAAEDFDEILDVAKVTRLIPELHGRQSTLRKVAEDLGYGTSRVDGKKNGRILRYPEENLQQDVIRLREVDPKKADELQAKLDSKMDGISGLADFIPELKIDYRFSDLDLDGLYLQSRRLAWQEPAKYGTGYRELSDSSRSLTYNLNNLNDKLARATKEGADEKTINSLTSRIRAHESRRYSVNRRKDSIQADIIRKLLDNHISQKQGAKVYRDQAQADELLNELNAIDQQMNGGGPAVGDLSHLSQDTADHALGTDKSSLELRRIQINHELKQLEGLPESPVKDLSKVPEHFKDTNGKFNEGALRNKLKFDRFHGLYTIKDGKYDPWLEDIRQSLQVRYDVEFDKRWNSLIKPIREKFSKTSEVEDQLSTIVSGNKKAQAPEYYKNPKYRAEYNDALKQASEDADKAAVSWITSNIETGNLKSLSNSSMRLYNAPVTEDEIIRAMAWKRGEEYAEARAKLIAEKRGAPAREVARIDRQLNELKSMHKTLRAAERKAANKAKEARKIMETRLRENAILRIADANVVNKGRAVSVNTWGDRTLFTIPGSEAMFKSLETLGNAPILKQAGQTWAKAFISPTNKFKDSELIIARSRAMVQPHITLREHTKQLTYSVGKFDKAVREKAFITSGGDLQAKEAITEAFDPIIPYLTSQRTVGGEVLTLDEVNKYLGKGLHIPSKVANSKNLSAWELRKEMSAYPKLDNNARKILDDPYELSWNLRIATDLAMANKGLRHTIKNTFGVRRQVRLGPGKNVLENETEQTIEKLKGLGWEQIDEIDNNYLFPPEIAPDIRALVKMMEPRNITEFGKMFDRATGYWKLISTVYSPAYWTNNGIGEAMSSWFAGVHNPEWYKKAGSLISYMRHDSKDLEAIADSVPSVKVEKNKELGKKVVLTAANKPVTISEVEALAYDTGIKTNFFNTEFNPNFSRAETALRGTPGTKHVMSFNDKARSAGEHYEDYFRMAHFMHAMNKSKARTVKGAAEEAALEVRKYHFDYTDFTQFEKMVMLRAFPFYKWTRKALPLMMTMLFTKPGKVMAYPKAMNAVSNTVSSKDIYDDENGFAPNYEGTIPSFIQDQWAYFIGSDENEMDSYLSINTPQMDSYKTAADPSGRAGALLHPLAKLLIGEAQDHTIGSNLGMPDDMEETLGGHNPLDKESLSNTAGLVPIGQFLERIVNSGGKYLKDDPDSDSIKPSEGMIKFLTGLGVYENMQSNWGEKEKEAK